MMKKTLTLILTVGTLALTSMSVFATERTPISIGDGDIEIVTPKDNNRETFDWEVYNRRVRGGCNLDECDTYGECGDYANCLNGPGRDGLRTNSMRTNSVQGNSGRSCCR